MKVLLIFDKLKLPNCHYLLSRSTSASSDRVWWTQRHRGRVSPLCESLDHNSARNCVHPFTHVNSLLHWSFFYLQTLSLILTSVSGFSTLSKTWTHWVLKVYDLTLSMSFFFGKYIWKILILCFGSFKKVSRIVFGYVSSLS